MSIPKEKQDDTKTKAALQERVKELTCLYEVARLATKKENESLANILQNIANIIPSAWQYPEITECRLLVNSQKISTNNYVGTGKKQVAEIIIGKEACGTIEVTYKEKRKEAFEGPFLKEERHLIDAVAVEISNIVERFKAQEERERLDEQLRHADRLATIGQLAAGVAHELNEPLGNILGFAQLASKNETLPKETVTDLQKIIVASLHARKIVSKLNLFARQMPSKFEKVSLNELIEDNLFFISTRCSKLGIQINKNLAADLPIISADSGQIIQVLTNLTVNALQAMPDGGILTISTKTMKNNVILSIEDTGTGMSESIIKQIFIPFYTTKDVDEGTGLGLSVVDGIIKSHSGSITVSSNADEGSKFTVTLPINNTKIQPLQI